ncbi:MAG: Magnesium and cobalt efflux protein CorC [Verrucomicrobia subdivision 3 bacterium]|nr:Magnesium and cobalt efflux protein CorC [Limisphaerales bacterium]MCS1414182.1 Magnesium and cobalt efflux protein CorC [Limisphaerales bacterium]
MTDMKDDYVSAIGLELIIVFALILGNGMFAMAEMAVVSSRKPKLKYLAQSGNKRAKKVLELVETPNHFLSTVQFGITIIGILAGAFGGATIANKLTPSLAKIPWIADFSSQIALALVVAFIAFATLVLGEIVPKRLALHAPEKTSMMIAEPISRLGKLVSPFVQIISWVTDSLLDLIGVKRSEDPTITREEVQVMVEQGSHAGVFHHAEIGMVEGVMRLDEERVDNLMTPRPKIVWLDADEEENVNWRKIVTSNYSYFPLYSENRDNVIGMVSVKAMWANISAGIKTNLRNLAVPPLIVPETMVAVKLLEAFKQSGKHTALVTDEFGSVTGLVTLIDVLEAIVGDIPSEEEKHKDLYIKRDDGSYLIEAMMEVDDFKDLLQLKNLPNETINDYHSVGGFALSLFGRIPTEGDNFQHEGYRFEVVDMDRHRIDKILAIPMPQVAEAEAKAGDIKSS